MNLVHHTREIVFKSVKHLKEIIKNVGGLVVQLVLINNVIKILLLPLMRIAINFSMVVLPMVKDVLRKLNYVQLMRGMKINVNYLKEMSNIVFVKIIV